MSLRRFCTHCAQSTDFDEDLSLGLLVCTQCGTVDALSSSAALDATQRQDEDDPYQNGMTYVAATGAGGGGGFGATGLGAVKRAGGRASQWASGAGEGREVYHARKRDEAYAYLGRLLSHFGLRDALEKRARYLFDEAKRRVEFKWGGASEVFAAACVYIAANEKKRNVWLYELADIVDEVKELHTLTRAIRIVKLECATEAGETEPAMFLERILAHLNALGSPSSSSAATPSSVPAASPTKWKPANLTWARSIPLPRVRILATDLLAFSSDMSLTVGRHPEQVASAAVLVAMEGVARSPAPALQEFAADLGRFLGGSAYTITERYREFYRVIAEYSAELPWAVAAAAGLNLGGGGGAAGGAKKSKSGANRAGIGGGPGGKARAAGTGTSKNVRRELVLSLEVVVQLRKGIEARREKKKLEEEEACSRPTGRLGSPVVEEPEEDEEEREQDATGRAGQPILLQDPLSFASASTAFLSARCTSSTPAPAPPPPLPSASAAPFDVQSAVAGLPVDAPTYLTPFPTPRARQASLQPSSASERKAKRPVEFTRERNTAKRLKADSTPPTTSLSPFPSSQPFLAASTAPLASLPSPSPSLAPTPTPSAPLPSLTSTGPSSSALPGPGPSTRLSRLLWTKPASSLSDSELFDEGELDAYVRDQPAVEAFLRLPKTQAMLREADEVAQRVEARGQGEKKPSRRRRGRLFKTYCPPLPEGEDGPALPSGSAPDGGPDGGPKTRQRRATYTAYDSYPASSREGTVDSDVSDGFKARKGPTKLKPGASARIAELLAMDGLGQYDDEEAMWEGLEGGAAGGGGAAEAFDLGLARQAAREEGEDVDEEEEEHEEGHERAVAAKDDEEDWRATLGYSQRPEEEYEEY
ncbi:hypothetical protein JCM8097_005986 [Rhodosporidiobolus ruineniae]